MVATLRREVVEFPTVAVSSNAAKWWLAAAAVGRGPWAWAVGCGRGPWPWPWAVGVGGGVGVAGGPDDLPCAPTSREELQAAPTTKRACGHKHRSRADETLV